MLFYLLQILFQEMYQFIFEVVLRYMQSFETYSNFSV